MENLWSTIEPEDLVQKAYPELVSVFLESKKKKSTKKTSKSTKTNSPDENEIQNNDETTKKKKPKKISGDQENKMKTRKTKTTKQKSQDTGNALIEQFFKKVKIPSYQSPKIKTCSSPLNLSNISLDFTSNDANLSDIIQGIVQKTPELTELEGRKLRYDVYSSSVPSNVTCLQSKENKIVQIARSTPLTELSYDEFDVMVMGKQKNCFSNEHSSTPTRAREKSKPTKRTSRILELKSTKKLKNSRKPMAEVSSFFGSITLDGDTDLFEKSVDFKNMPDEFIDVNESHKISENNFEIQLKEDTFNLTSYVPVGDNLRRKLSDS